jgi:hypothetical protein
MDECPKETQGRRAIPDQLHTVRVDSFSDGRRGTASTFASFTAERRPRPCSR